MRGNDLKSMSVDELWKLHEEVTVSSLKNYSRKKPGSSNGCVRFEGPTTYRAFIGRAALTQRARRADEAAYKVGNRKRKPPLGERGLLRWACEAWGTSNIP